MSLHFLIFPSLPHDFYLEISPFGLDPRRVTGLCLLCRFLCFDQVLPCLSVWGIFHRCFGRRKSSDVWALFDFIVLICFCDFIYCFKIYVFVESSLVWHDMHLSRYALVLLWHSHDGWKAPEDQWRPTSWRLHPFQSPFKRHCIWGSCSIIAEVISAFSARSCATKLPSVSMQGSIMPGADLDFWGRLQLHCCKPPSEGEQHLTWGPQLHEISPWWTRASLSTAFHPVNMASMDLGLEDSGTVSLWFSSFSYLDTCMLDCLIVLVRMLLAFSY